jgi:putative ABC transport system substrate-binding protein
MRRRQFITVLGGATVALPLSARGQQAMPVIGFLNSGAPEAITLDVAAFRSGLNETGFVEGQNLLIEFRWAHNEIALLPELAADLVRCRVAVIAIPGGATGAARAAKAATTTIPIAVQTGLVASLNHPGGNLTGVSYMRAELVGKQLGLLNELLPGAARFAVLVNPTSALTAPMVTDLRIAASSIGREIEILNATTNREIDAAFETLAQRRLDALLVTPDLFLTNRGVQIVTLTARYAVPSMYPSREFTDAGGLMSYGSSSSEQYRQVGIYTGRILKGEKPADLPVMRPTKFELVINLQTARTLRLVVPETLLDRADEVIE